MSEDREKLRTIANGWIAVGALVLIALGAFAIAHYGYDVPILERKKGIIASPEKVRFTILMIGSLAAVFLGLGLLLRKWTR